MNIPGKYYVRSFLSRYLLPSPLALGDSPNVSGHNDIQSIRDLLSGSLNRLVRLHARGYMHRDIHIRNLFILFYHPPHAVLGDLGKVIKSRAEQDTHVGPIDTLAPEVDRWIWYSNRINI